MKINKNTRLLAAGLFSPGAAGIFSSAVAAPEFELRSSLSNRYVTEGIDNDPDSNGFAFTEFVADLDPVALGFWYGQSLSGSSYNEVNLFAEYGFELNGVELFAGLNFLTYPAPDDANSWEVYLGAEYEVSP